MVPFTWTFVNLFGVLVAIIIVIYTYFKWSYQYWKKKNVPYLKPSIPFGNYSNPFTRNESIGLTYKKIYNIMKANKWDHLGFYAFAVPTYFVGNLEYIKNIMTKDFQYFVDRGFYYNEKDDPLSAHLFAIGGVKWRNLRTKMTPTFTSGKMRMMFQTVADCGDILHETINKLYEKKEPLDIKEILACFTMDVIGSCAFGLDFNAIEGANSPFRRFGKRTFEFTRFRIFQFIFGTYFPKTANALHFRVVDQAVAEFFINIVKETVEYREKNNVVRDDFMQLLIDMKNNKLNDADYKNDGNTLTIEELAAQSFIFFSAGFETSSTTMTFALYEMARHQDIQQKVRDEIHQVLAKHDNKITYDAIIEMKFMNQVIEETLRKYPPLPFLTRQCVKDYKLPDKDIIIEKGTRIIIPVMGIHHDKNYYDDPDKFDPERFTEENKQKRHPYAYLPFGEGPRTCIGLRFGMMQSKVGLISMLKSYKFTVSPKTKQPLKMQATSFILAVDGDVWLEVEKVNP